MPKLTIAFIAAIIMTVVMQWQGSSLVNETATMGIVNLEIDRPVSRVEEVIASNAKNDWYINIALDFVYIFFYTAFFYMASLSFHKKERPLFKGKAGKWFIKLSIAAGVLDVIENLSMLWSLNSGPSVASIWIARHASIIKFGFLGILIIVLLTSLVLNFAKWNKSRTPGK